MFVVVVLLSFPVININSEEFSGLTRQKIGMDEAPLRTRYLNGIWDSARVDRDLTACARGAQTRGSRVVILLPSGCPRRAQDRCPFL